MSPVSPQSSAAAVPRRAGVPHRHAEPGVALGPRVRRLGVEAADDDRTPPRHRVLRGLQPGPRGRPRTEWSPATGTRRAREAARSVPGPADAAVPGPADAARARPPPGSGPARRAARTPAAAGRRGAAGPPGTAMRPSARRSAARRGAAGRAGPSPVPSRAGPRWWCRRGSGAVRRIATSRVAAPTVHCRTGDSPWQLLKLDHLDLPATVDVGVMCCSPERAGLVATFRDFRIGPPISRDRLE